MPTEVSGSKVPGWPSQIRIGGWLTNARAIETRCCSPPDSSSREGAHLVRKPHEVQDLGNLRPDVALGFALHLEGIRDVLERGAVGQQLEVLEDAPDVPAEKRLQLPLQACQLPAADDDPSIGGLELLDHQRIMVDFPDPDAPTRKTNSLRSIVNETSLRATTFGSYTFVTASNTIIGRPARRRIAVRHGSRRHTVRPRRVLCQLGILRSSHFAEFRGSGVSPCPALGRRHASRVFLDPPAYRK